MAINVLKTNTLSKICCAIIGVSTIIPCATGADSAIQKKLLNSELDFCEGNDLYIKELPEGVKTGRFDSSLVERATRNVLRTKIISGMIDGVPVIPEKCY